MLGKGLVNRAKGFAQPAPSGRELGTYMQTIVVLLKDKAGISSIKMALMIGLSSSAVLVLVRIGVAAAGQ